jgi:hypothetical protein
MTAQFGALSNGADRMRRRLTQQALRQDAVLGAELGELEAHTLAGDYVANGALGFAAVQ